MFLIVLGLPSRPIRCFSDLSLYWWALLPQSCSAKAYQLQREDTCISSVSRPYQWPSSRRGNRAAGLVSLTGELLRCWGIYKHLGIPWVWDGVWDFAFLTRSHMMPIVDHTSRSTGQKLIGGTARSLGSWLKETDNLWASLILCCCCFHLHWKTNLCIL